MREPKLVSRPWVPQDLLDDLQLMIYEEPDRYLNDRRTTLCMARDFLKAYFDTGLEPEQIIRARDTLECFDNIGIKRGNEIVKAEQEGRLVVLDEPRLPLIWGDDDHDTILCPKCSRDLMGGFELADSCEVTIVQCPYCGQPIDGTKALTREEAEKAMEGQK